MHLRPYQEQAVYGIWRYFQQGGTGNPIVAMPTGTGKSVVIARFIQSVLEAYPTQHVLNLTHVKELIEQNSNQIARLYPGCPLGVFSAGLGRREPRQVTVAGIQSVHKRARLFQHTNLVLIDECHLVSPNESSMYQTFLEDLRRYSPHVKVIGFSATPYRLGQGMLTDGGLFTDICVDQTSPEYFSYFIDNNWLSPLVPKRTAHTLNVDGMRIRAGEYMAVDVDTAMGNQRLTANAIAEALVSAQDRQHWMVFASSIDHAEECLQLLHMNGVSAVMVHSKMSSEERDKNIALFKEGRVRAIVNKDILTTGFDAPGVDCIIMLRPTASPGLWGQMLGRGTRVAPGKENCLVLDFAGNTARLGPIDRPRIPKRAGAGGEAPMRVCPGCATYILAALTTCPHCGHEFPRNVEPMLTPEASQLSLLSSKDTPQMEVFPVLRMVVEEALSRKDQTPMLRALYFCGAQGVRRFSTFACFEHHGYAKRKAAEWWKQHCHTDTIIGNDPPDNVRQAIAYSNDLFKPTHIRVWVNKAPYPEIMAYDFTGTAFGSEPAAVPAAREADVAVHRPAPRPATFYDSEDDIPF